MFNNRDELVFGPEEEMRAHALDILKAGIDAVEPYGSIMDFVSRKGDTLVVAEASYDLNEIPWREADDPATSASGPASISTLIRYSSARSDGTRHEYAQVKPQPYSNLPRLMISPLAVAIVNVGAAG